MNALVSIGVAIVLFAGAFVFVYYTGRGDALEDFIQKQSQHALMIRNELDSSLNCISKTNGELTMGRVLVCTR